MFVKMASFFPFSFFSNVFPIALAGNFSERQNTDCGDGNELACYQLTPGEYADEHTGSLHCGMVPVLLFSPLLLAGCYRPPFRSAPSLLLKLERCQLHGAKVAEN